MAQARQVGFLRPVAAMSAAFALVACGSSTTSPKVETPAQLAAYYDALAGSHLAAGTRADTLYAQLIEVLDGPIAYGQLPTQVAVQVNGTNATWFATVINAVDTAAVDSTLMLVAWPDTAVSQVILGRFIPSTMPHLAQIEHFVVGDIYSFGDTSSVTASEVAQSGQCATGVTMTNEYAFLPTYQPSNQTCSLLGATIGGHLHFPAATGIAALDLDMTATSVAGVRLRFLHGSYFFDRVHAVPPRGARH